MSEYKRIQIQCPACGETSAARVYVGVNVTLEPELKDGVLSGALFAFRCPACGYTARMDRGFLYHDMRGRYMIRYEPQDGEKDAPGAEAAELGASGYALRRVSAFDDLIEKITVFDAGLDDRVVELCKLDLLRTLAREKPQLDVMRVLIDRKDGALYAVFVDRDADAFAIELPEDLYNAVYSDYYDDIARVSKRGFLKIDADWARALYRE